jgi:hypothetical protein
MNARVIVGQRVKDFLETLAPVPRRKLWRGLKGLAQDEGDRKHGSDLRLQTSWAQHQLWVASRQCSWIAPGGLSEKTGWLK